MLKIKEFRREDIEDDVRYIGILELEKPRVSFGNDITSKEIEIKCSSNGEECGGLKTEEKLKNCSDEEKEEKEECKKPTYHVPGLRLGFSYQPIISFK